MSQTTQIEICAHPNARKTIQIFDRTRLDCPDCGLSYVESRSHQADPKIQYEEYYRDSQTSEQKKTGRFGYILESLIHLLRLYRAFKISRISPGAQSILDIGSRGLELSYLKKYFGFKRAAGTQMARNVCDYARDHLGLEMYHEDILKLALEEKSFDLVTMWHVLEHVHEPERTLQKISGLLKDSGKLIFEVPNLDAWTAALTSQYWLGYEQENHLSFFNTRSLTYFLHKHGFEIESVHSFSLEYSTFFSVQSIVSRITQTDYYFFRYLAGTRPMDSQFIWHTLLFTLLTPFCFLINLALFFTRKGEVLIVTARKKP